MPCRNICTSYKARRQEHGSYYSNGYKRCNECELFLKWNGPKCPCCLLGNELVYTSQGVKQIADIQEGEFVLDKEGRYTKVLRRIEHNYNGYICKIKVSGHKEVAMTEEHPVFFMASRDTNSQQVGLIHLHQARDLCLRDELIFPHLQPQELRKYWMIERKHKKYYDNTKYQRIRDLNDNFGSLFHSRKTYLQFIPITEELCRLWGYYLAEGSCKDREVTFYFDKDEIEYLKDIESILEEIGFSYTRITQDKRSRTRHITIASAALARALVRDFGKLAEGKHLPNWIFSLTAQCRKELIKGWVRGDGGKRWKNGISKGYSVITISRSMAYDMRLLLSSLGYLVPIFENNKQVGGRKTTYMLWLSKKCGKELLDDIECGINPKKQRYSVYERFMTIPVVNIKKEMYNGKVYNLTTESETYMTSAFLVHNCGKILRTRPHNTRLKAKLRSV